MSRPGHAFAFVAACCVWRPSEAWTLGIREAAANLDWRSVLAVARRHRVEGLLWRGLQRAGVEPSKEVAASLREAASVIARQSLVMAAETVRVQAALEADAISSLVLKGAAVELLAYGRLGLKSAKDIDILVAPDNAMRAIVALVAAGYRLSEPVGLTAAQFDTWIRLGRDCGLVDAQRGVEVELHWRVVDSPRLIPEITVASPSQRIPVGGGAITALRDEELFAFLSVHGATHGWSRLKWLCELSALAESRPVGIERLYRSAVAAQAGLCPALALLLCRRLLGLELPAAIDVEIGRNPIVRWLVVIALDAMSGGELEDRPFGTTGISLSQLFLTGRLWDVPHEIAYRRRRGPDLSLYVASPGQSPLFYVWKRLKLWVTRRIVWRSMTSRR